MMNGLEISELLEHIDPSLCSYHEWCSVGMALKHEGYDVSIWDAWSSRDGRYHFGECAKKWNSFLGTSVPVTGGTIYQLALQQGWRPSDGGHELDWDDEITADVVVDKNWVEGREISEPDSWDPAKELITYLETLFESSENVGYVTESYENDKGKYIPRNKGHWDRTSGQLIEALKKCGGDIGAVIGDYEKDGGAWIRFNPLDGKGVRNENVIDFRYALVESDSMDLEKQNQLLRDMNLPIACLVYSGSKSVHAIVRIEAGDYAEYRKRVDYLYSVCKKNGMEIDTQNRNPSRLSRMPGCERAGKKQFIIDTNIGANSWLEWVEWLEGQTDDMPETESLADVFDALPELADCLIDGILRQGHKMLISGPSKAGKSFLMIELVIAIAEGKKWLNWQCKQGQVLYVNLELDRASCLHRFRDVYEAACIAPEHIENIDIWNLRGVAVPMDKLVPKLIRRAQKKHYIAVIIDPIYKVITGDENSASEMAKFCNQFDRICREIGCSVIYSHHHSKGSQSQKKTMDRASGSGVFARDPDALIDMIELEKIKAVREKALKDKLCRMYGVVIDREGLEGLSDEDMKAPELLEAYLENNIDPDRMAAVREQANVITQRVRAWTGWRIDGVLREFLGFDPVNLWFDYPLHLVDESGELASVTVGEELPERKSKQESNESRKDRAKRNFDQNYDFLAAEGPVTVQAMADAMGITERTVRRRVSDFGDEYLCKNNVIIFIGSKEEN